MQTVWLSVWQLVLMGHAAGALTWIWMMPGGFPWWHARFLANAVLPSIVIAVAIAGLLHKHKEATDGYRAVFLFFPVFWTTALLAAAIVFPISARRFFAPGAGGVVFLWGLFLLSFRREWSWRWTILASLVASVLIGSIVPIAERAPQADTKPIESPISAAQPNQLPSPAPHRIEIGRESCVRPADATVVVRCGRRMIEIQPLLQFESISPDRCWTILAPRSYHPSSRLRLTGLATDGMATSLALAGYLSHLLRIQSNDEHQTIIEAYTHLDEPVYSHLNTFCQLSISGHRRLALSFSPCPNARIEVLPADYPAGRPARHAYLAADRSFHVVEARSGEKGPFRTLARGTLSRAESLRITLYDEETPICEVEFQDWAAQASTTLSPTAGWKVPVNAIEFQRLGEPPGSMSCIWMTLAATSVGRGWDSVGHSPGTYRNRMSIKSLKE